MGYLHINNLYKDQEVLLHDECYAMEKIHGTSARVSWRDGEVKLFSGGVKMNNFAKLFDVESLKSKFMELDGPDFAIFGEAYGGKCQAMSPTYGKDLKFVAFDVKFGDRWLTVPEADAFVKQFGIEFVHYVRVQCDMKFLDEQRDADSVQAIRNGTGHGHIREGIVIRPIVEMEKANGNRVIAKHKRPEFSETVKKRTVSQEKLEILSKAKDIAFEWVTEQRLNHVLDKVFAADEYVIERTGDVIKAMIADVRREAAGEIVESKAAWGAIGKRTAILFKRFLNNKIGDKN